MTRDDDGPMFGILRSEPSGRRKFSIGSVSAWIVAAARLYPHALCFDACTAARSRSSAAMAPLVSEVDRFREAGGAVFRVGVITHDSDTPRCIRRGAEAPRYDNDIVRRASAAPEIDNGAS